MNTVQEAWLASLLSSIDAMAVEPFVQHLGPDVEFRFGNPPPAWVVIMVGSNRRKTCKQ